MPQAMIKYFGEPAKVCCDGLCTKAWGNCNRPERKLSDEPGDVYYLSDSEIDGDAPADPGTREGGQAKPPNAAHFPNKWCVRECERCAMTALGQPDRPLGPPDWSAGKYNMPWLHEKE